MFRLIIYLSGLLGFFLLTAYIFGLFAEKSYNVLTLIIALVLIFLISGPMILVERYRRKKNG
jgi:positive regulator of sigma E activity